MIAGWNVKQCNLRARFFNRILKGARYALPAFFFQIILSQTSVSTFIRV